MLRMGIVKGWRRRLGLGLVGLIALLGCAKRWAVPALIVGQIEARYGGKVTIQGWWIDARSAGVVGLTLHEGPGAGSPVWASAPRVETDLSLAGLFRGRFAPKRVTLRSPRVAFRLDRDGRPLTRIPLKAEKTPAKTPAPLPAVVVDDARVSLRQEGRPEMVLSGIDARLTPGPRGASQLWAKAVEQDWGRWEAVGAFAPGFQNGEVRLNGRDVVVTPDKEIGLPFVPADVWKNVVARGPVDLGIVVRLDASATAPVHVRTTIGLRRTALTLPALGLETTGTTGEVVVDGGVVTLNRLEGRAMGGAVEANGTMNFSKPPPRIDLTLKLDRVNVADAPKGWKLDRSGLDGGRMTGRAGLRVALAPDGPDLSGSWGDGVIQGATLQGVPVKSLRLVMSAEGKDLKYETAGVPRTGGSAADADRIAYEAARAGALPPAGPKRKGSGFQLPRSFSTEIDLEDVELSRLVDKAALLGIKVPVEVAGRFTLKAKATIPLGALRDVKGYLFQGRLTLLGASIAGVDLGRATADIDLADGVLEITNLRGRLVDLPDGGRDHRPAATAPVPPRGPLPSGGFRGRLRAELSPPGRMSARVEANQLPLGELAAPYLPRPTPLSGLVSLDLNAEASVAALSDPKAWRASGSLQSVQITYRDTTLDTVSTRFSLDGGWVTIPGLTAKLTGRPLSAQLKAELSAPYAYAGKIDVADWDLDDVLALVPGVPQPSPAGGLLTVRADAKGTLAPWSVETQGQGRVARARVGPVPVGDVPFRWSTEPGVVVLSGVEARPLGGRLTAHARVPTHPGSAAEGQITLLGLDTALLAVALHEDALKLTGRADVRVSCVIPTEHRSDNAAVVADVRVSAPDLTVHGVPARGARGAVAVRDGVLTYQVAAETLDGTIKFDGALTLAAAMAGGAPSRARLQAGWFSLGQFWQSEGVTGPLANLHGLAALGARIDLTRDPTQRRAEAVAELRALRWGKTPVGSLRGVAAITTTAWRVAPLSGDLLGGSVQGDLWGPLHDPDPARLGFDLRVDRLDLGRLAAFLPGRAHEHDLSGWASVHLAGCPQKAGGEVRIEQARVFDLPLADLRLPAEFLFTPETGVGTILVRESSARLAGGIVRCDALLRFGASEDARIDLHLNNVDLKAFKNFNTDERRPATGKVSGRVKLESPAPGQLRRIRGTAHLDLTDASLFELPVFRQINQFLGSEHGGIFEAGELDLTVAAGKLKLSKLALVGRLIQLRARGTIGLNGLIDLDLIVKPNQVLPQTGRAVVTTVLGLGRRPRGDDAKVLRTTNPLSDGPVKLHVSGTLKDPKVVADPSINFDEE